jgi:hypothetical protein
MNLTDGRYQIVVEVENSEVARFNIDFSSPYKNEMRQDIEFKWSGEPGGSKAGVVSVADEYKRRGKNAAMFSTATKAIEQRIRRSPYCARSWKPIPRIFLPGRSSEEHISSKRILLMLKSLTRKR